MNTRGRLQALGIVLLIGLAGSLTGFGASGLEVQFAGDIRYVSGGIGKAEQLALKEARPDYNLHLTFAHRGGAFLARVPVSIRNESGHVVLEAVSRGPYLLARLPAGDYRVSATNDGNVQTRNISVAPDGPASLRFYWVPQDSGN